MKRRTPRAPDAIGGELPYQELLRDKIKRRKLKSAKKSKKKG